VNQRRGWRLTTAKAFLRGADRGKLEVATGAHIRRVLVEDGRAIGVEYEQGGKTVVARTRREVILCAGAIGSPQILQLSGIGRAALLRGHGIEVLRDVPAIGANLQDHLQLRCTWRLEGARTLNTMANSLWGKVRIGLEYAVTRRGPMSMAPSQLGAFAHSREGLETPDLEFHVQPLSLEAFGQPLDDFDAMTASVCNLRPQSRGVVEIKSPEARDAPRIAPNYLSTPSDRQVAVASIRLARRIMAQGAMARYAPQEMKPGTAAESDADLAQAAGDIGTTIFHAAGTVAMGADPKAPVDPQLRLRAVGALRVVDASVMPRITSGNTNSPVIMIAEKASDMILADAR